MDSQVLFASPQQPSASAMQALSPAQSLTVIEIFINAAIACICHSRELIPWDATCFGTRYIDDLNSNFWKDEIDGYSTFCDTERSVPFVKSQEFRILKRREDKRADGILDLVETGIFPAVASGFLDAVRFFITQGSTDCDMADVLESYTLNFTYDHGHGNNGGVRSISLNSMSAFTTDNAIKSFKRAIKSLLISLQGLPLMPRRRSLGVMMLYNNRCPSTYETPGFLTEEVYLATEEHSGWHKMLLQPTGKVGQFEAGSYRVVLGTSHLGHSTEVPTTSRLRDLNTGRQLQNWQKSSSLQNNGFISTLDDPGPNNSHSTSATSGFFSKLGSLDPSSQVMPRSSTNNGSQRGCGSGSTPLATLVMTCKSRKRNVAPEKLAEAIVQACALEANQEEDPIFSVKDLQQNKIVRLNASFRRSGVQCECGSKSNTEDLLLCNLCGTSQHKKCYGWDGFPQTKLPDEHLCYSCLLLPKEAGLAARMRTLVLTRLAVAHIQHNSPTNVQYLMNAMHLSKTQKDQRIAKEILDELQGGGYIVRNKSEIIATMDKGPVSEALRSFTNPLAQISHHFTALKDGNNAQARADAIAVAMNEYTRGRAYLPGECHAEYEQEVVLDSLGKISVRWGFYSQSKELRKRKARSPDVEGSPTPKRSALARKASCHERSLPNRATSPPTQSRRTSAMRKAGRCEALVRLDRSSPSTIFSIDGALAEAVNVATSEVQWEAYTSGGREQDRSETELISKKPPKTTMQKRG